MTREEAKQASDWFRNRSKAVTMPGARRMYLLAIEALSAQPQRKKGKWIILPPIFEEICQCSKCKMKFKDALQWTNYCPNCGADMRGESDE